jgi:hypothetical protein
MGSREEKYILVPRKAVNYCKLFFNVSCLAHVHSRLHALGADKLLPVDAVWAKNEPLGSF